MSQRAEDWRYSAACQKTNPELFFPGIDGEDAISQTAEAKKVCATCPVQAACLAWAFAKGQQHGVWGGLSASERKKVGAGGIVRTRRPLRAWKPAERSDGD